MGKVAVSEEILDMFESLFLIYEEDGKIIYASESAKRYFPNIESFSYYEILPLVRPNFVCREVKRGDKTIVVAIDPLLIINLFLRDFLAELIHKVENPLSGVAGFLGLMRTKAEGDKKLSEYIQKAVSGLHRVDEILKAISPLVEKESSRLGIGDFGSFFADFADKLRNDPRWKLRGINLEIEPSNSRVSMFFDPTMLRFAFESIAYFIERKLKRGDSLRILCRKDDRKRFSVLMLAESEVTFEEIFVTEKVPAIEVLVAKKIIRDHKGDLIIGQTQDGQKSIEIRMPVAEEANNGAKTKFPGKGSGS